MQLDIFHRCCTDTDNNGAFGCVFDRKPHFRGARILYTTSYCETEAEAKRLCLDWDAAHPGSAADLADDDFSS